MTNITYFYAVVRDDCSSVDESSLESGVSADQVELESYSGQENVLRSGPKSILSPVFGKGCFNFGRLVNLSGLKGESSNTTKVQVEEEERSWSETVSNQRPPIMPNHAHGELIGAGWPSWRSLVAGEASKGWVPCPEDSFEKLDKYFTTKPYACEPSDLPQYPTSKEMDAKLCEEVARRLQAAALRGNDGVKKNRPPYQAQTTIPTSKANIEPQAQETYNRQLFIAKPYASEPLDLPQYPARKEMDVKLCEEVTRRLQAADLRGNGGVNKSWPPYEAQRSIPTPKANIEHQVQQTYHRQLFTTETHACEPLDLAQYPTRKEMDDKLCEEVTRRLQAADLRGNDGVKKNWPPCQAQREILTPTANIEHQAPQTYHRQLSTTKTYACEPLDLAQYSSRKEMDAKLCEDVTRRLQAADLRGNDGVKKSWPPYQAQRAIPTPIANIEHQAPQTYHRQRQPTIKSEDANSEDASFSWRDHQMDVGDSSSSNLDPALIGAGYYHPSVFTKHLPTVSGARKKRLWFIRRSPKVVCSLQALDQSSFELLSQQDTATDCG